MNFSLLPPKRENSEAAIAYVERLRWLYSESDFCAIEKVKGAVDGFIPLLIVLPLSLMFTDWEGARLGLFLPCLLMFIYCSAYSSRLKELLKIYDTGDSFRQRVKRSDTELEERS